MLSCKWKNVKRTRAADLEECFYLSSPDHFSSPAVLAGRDCKGAEHTGDMLCFERGYPRLSQSPLSLLKPLQNTFSTYIPNLHQMGMQFFNCYLIVRVAGMLHTVLLPLCVLKTQQQTHATHFIFRMKAAICSISPCLCLLHLPRLKAVVCVKVESLQLMNFYFFRDDSHHNELRKPFPTTRLFLKESLAPVWESWLQVVGCSGTCSTQRQTS